MSKDFRKISKGLSLTPQTLAPTDPENGDFYYDLTLGIRVYDNGSWQKAGGSAGEIKVALIDRSTATLPSVAPLDIDGVTVQDGDNVLFTNLSVNNNRIYKATVVGITVTWDDQAEFNGNVDPSTGDVVRVVNGDTHSISQFVFDGTDWLWAKISLIDNSFGSGTEPFDFGYVNDLKVNELLTVQSSSGAMIKMLGSTSGILDIDVPATITDYTLILPDAQGGADEFLQNDGSGNLSWVAVSTELVNDLTPELGGDLNGGDFNISSVNSLSVVTKASTPYAGNAIYIDHSADTTEAALSIKSQGNVSITPVIDYSAIAATNNLAFNVGFIGGQSFLAPSTGDLYEVTFNMFQNSLSAGSVRCRIVTDNAGDPDVGNVLGTSDLIAYNAINDGLNTFVFSTPVTLTSGTLYYAIVDSVAGTGSFIIRSNNTQPYVDGNTVVYNTTSWADYTQDMVFAISYGSETDAAHIRFVGKNSGYVEVFAPSTITDYNLTLPAAQGASDTYLKNDGSGNLNWEVISSATSASSGEVNLIENGFFSQNSSGWFVYTTAASLPTAAEITENLAANSTFVRSTVEPLVGEASGLFTRSSSDANGVGFAKTFVVAEQDKNRQLKVEFEYEYESDDCSSFINKTFMYISDGSTLLNNTELKQVPIIENNGTAASGKIRGKAYFEFDSNTNPNLTFSIHFATTAITGQTFKIDNVIIGPKLVRTNYDSRKSYIRWDAENGLGGVSTFDLDGSAIDVPQATDQKKLNIIGVNLDSFTNVSNQRRSLRLELGGDLASSGRGEGVYWDFEIDYTEADSQIVQSIEIDYFTFSNGQPHSVGDIKVALQDLSDYSIVTLTENNLGTEINLSFNKYISSWIPNLNKTKYRLLVYIDTDTLFIADVSIDKVYVGSDPVAQIPLTSESGFGLIKSPQSELPIIESGTYTPTVTPLTNLTSIIAFTDGAQYLRVGNIVTVGFRARFDGVSNAVLTTFSVSLPFPSAFTLSTDANGSAGTADTSTANNNSTGWRITSNNANGTATVAGYPPNVGGGLATTDITGTFTYQIK